MSALTNQKFLADKIAKMSQNIKKKADDFFDPKISELSNQTNNQILICENSQNTEGGPNFFFQSSNGNQIITSSNHGSSSEIIENMAI